MSKQKLIERQLEQAVMEGRWKLFERLPAERQLAEELRVNRTTLRAALSALVGRGILETTHGSGTRVRALPEKTPAHCFLADRLYASRIVIPPIVHASSLIIKPSQIIVLERLLPLAGAALRNDDSKAFVQAQIQFFMETAHFINNTSISAAMAACLPSEKSLARLFNSCSLQQYETLFAHLARILGAMRHAAAQDAAASAQSYFSSLQDLNLAEEK